ncbi:hypothetical protein SKAU_G00256150 [Synaphobranchus kaupii]|uniref:Uncharacterized protein n=1 Tax=Synaphobranchus kaupii TaxID=118154 RepID=A0A9Q1F448_SYNKA|nr:hypothetical protein SKAU_G00256150 [Synaphobranchus kaupii]
MTTALICCPTPPTPPTLSKLCIPDPPRKSRSATAEIWFLMGYRRTKQTVATHERQANSSQSSRSGG